MPKPNYAFEKRQRELEKKRKKEEKAQRKQQPRADGPADAPVEGSGAILGSAAPATPPTER